MQKADFISQLRNAFKKEPQILVAYVFGSYAKETAISESDFDLAVVINYKETNSEKKIYNLIKEISFPKNLDISVVNRRSSPLFLFEIVSRGQRVYVSDEFAACEFEAFVLNNYYDNSHLRNIYYSYLKDKFPFAYAH